MFLSVECFAQVETKIPPPVIVPKEEKKVEVDKDEWVFQKVEIEAEFPGGIKAWRDFLVKKLNPLVPSDKGAKPGLYTVIVRFIVSKEGNLSDIVAEVNPGFGTAEEVIRVMKLSPKWVAGVQNGVKVNSVKRQPLTFQIADK